MKALYLYHYSASETFSAAGAVISLLTGRHGENDLLQAAVSRLSHIQEDLRQAMVFNDQAALPARSKELDTHFNDGFVKLRNYVEITAEIAHLGQRARAAAMVRDIIHRHDRTLQYKPRDEQISLFDSVLRELPQEALEKAGVLPLLSSVAETHRELKEIEEQRRAVDAARREMPPPYELSETLRTLNAELSPLVTRVRTRITRRQKPPAESPYQKKVYEDY
ncbi:hypothetical protein [Chitinivibrio alkaliphilus]|uniref:Uncharacterized protein n=1 Tax=Chitinivibrio alkaliphilus ACht1 TaxID=1313304 RepID=U7D6K5_9BACT|nr:hypothetical protein [Chitinivibrio alkaliphilus]ERP30717.1 hypothetical protein CALK_2460 [Chitinivibrio alkaliphilus ACht1]